MCAKVTRMIEMQNYQFWKVDKSMLNAITQNFLIYLDSQQTGQIITH